MQTIEKHRVRNTILIALAIATVVYFTGCMASGEAGSAEAKTSSAKSYGFTYVSPSQLASSTSSSSSSSSDSTQPGAPGGGGASDSTYDYTGTLSATKVADGTTLKLTNKTLSSTTADQNVLLVENGGTLKGKNLTLKKSGSDTNGDNCNFYGLNSTLLAVGSSSKAYLSNSSITSTSTGSNGIFATDSAKVYANKVKITTKTGENSRGLDATYGGTIYANRMTISTAKAHCAALATDRGGGYISATNSKLSTKGSGSPLIYSTGDIEVENVTGTASGSQIAGMEGLNRILIYNSKLTSTNDALSGSDPIKNGVILYQSTSGDANTSTSSKADFEAVDSTLKTGITSGAMFYVTNTNAKILLKNTKLSYGSSSVNLLRAVGNSNNWGQTGSNGATVTFTGNKQSLKGNIVADTISTAKVYLTKKTTYKGRTKIITNSAGSSVDNNITMNVDKTSKWIVTGNSTVTNLNVAKGGKVVDKNGKKVTIKVNGKTKVKGTSKYTVNVTGSYSRTVKRISANNTSKQVLSRKAFDKYYGTSTTFGTNAGKKIGA